MVEPIKTNSPVQGLMQFIRVKSGSVGPNGAVRGSARGISEVLPVRPRPVSEILPGPRGLRGPQLEARRLGIERKLEVSPRPTSGAASAGGGGKGHHIDMKA